MKPMRIVGPGPDALAQALTHVCRHRPGLLLKPDHCESYRNSDGYYAALCSELQCPGPVQNNKEISMQAKAQPKPREPLFSYECKKHGPHDGTNINGRVSGTCPECTREKRTASLRENGSRMHRFNASMQKYPLVMEYLQQRAEGAGEDPFDLMCVIVLSQIDADWFKQQAIKGKKCI